jgi:hypothetical protein
MLLIFSFPYRPDNESHIRLFQPENQVTQPGSFCFVFNSTGDADMIHRRHKHQISAGKRILVDPCSFVPSGSLETWTSTSGLPSAGLQSPPRCSGVLFSSPLFSTFDRIYIIGQQSCRNPMKDHNIDHIHKESVTTNTNINKSMPAFQARLVLLFLCKCFHLSFYFFAFQYRFPLINDSLIKRRVF